MTALFKKEKEVEKISEVAIPVVEASKSAVKVSTTDGNFDSVMRNKSVLIRPRITEKASDLQSTYNVYTFDIVKDANKKEIESAIKATYGVQPARTRVVNIPVKKVRTRKGGKGVKAGGKKVYVYLKKGEVIDFV